MFIERDGGAISFVQTDPGVVAAGIERQVDKYDSQRGVDETNFRVYRRNRRETIPLICPPR